MTGTTTGYGPPDRNGNSWPKIEFRILEGMIQYHISGKWEDARRATEEELVLIQMASNGVSPSVGMFIPEK